MNGLCDCFMESLMGLPMSRCQNAATWQGDNEDGCLVFSCDEHADLLADGTAERVPASDEPEVPRAR